MQQDLSLTFTSSSLDCELDDLRDHNFHCPNSSCFSKTGVEFDENFLLHCPCFCSQRKGFLDLVSSLTGIEVMRLSSRELGILLLYSHNDLSVIVNCVIEETIKFIRSIVTVISVLL